MFGTYRTLLALAVMVHHLVYIPIIGQYAVHGFFILSGYLMTYVMTHSYGYNLTGVKSFAINRFLRLYPSYWCILAISIFAILIFGETASSTYRKTIYMPQNAVEWLQNGSLLFVNIFPGQEMPRISPATWALTIELFFYFLIAIGISKSRTITKIWCGIGLIYMVMTHLLDVHQVYRYNVVFAGSLPFSVGALIFHYKDTLTEWAKPYLTKYSFIYLFILFILNAFFAALFKGLEAPEFFIYLCFYLNYLINALIVIFLINGEIPFINRKLDNKIGDYSYPIYLFHWQAGFIASMLIWGEPIRGMDIKGFISLALAMALCLFISYLVIQYVDKPIQKLRKSIKEKANNQVQPARNNLCDTNT